MTLVLSNKEIAEIISMQDCVDLLEDAFIELAEGRGAFRRRSDICTPSDHESGGMYALKSMDGVIPKLGVGAIRINSDILTFPEDQRLPATGESAGGAQQALYRISPAVLHQDRRAARDLPRRHDPADAGRGNLRARGQVPVARQCRGRHHPWLRLAGAQPGPRHRVRAQCQGNPLLLDPQGDAGGVRKRDVPDRRAGNQGLRHRRGGGQRRRHRARGDECHRAGIQTGMDREGYAPEHDQTGRIQPGCGAARRTSPQP